MCIRLVQSLRLLPPTGTVFQIYPFLTHKPFSSSERPSPTLYSRLFNVGGPLERKGYGRSTSHYRIIMCWVGHHNPTNPQGTRPMPSARHQSPVGGLGWSGAGRGPRDESRGGHIFLGWETRWHPPPRLGPRGARRSAHSLVPGLWGDALSPKEWKPVLWELGSQGWVFHVFCNYFSFVHP